MRMSQFCPFFIAAAVLAGAAVLHAGAQPGSDGHARMHHAAAEGHNPDLCGAIHAHFQQLHDELQLTEIQVEAVHRVMQSHHGELAAAARPMLESVRALARAVHAERPDEAGIRTASESLGRTLGNTGVAFARIKAEVAQAAAFTPEQCAKFTQVGSRVDAAIGRMLDAIPAETPR